MGDARALRRTTRARHALSTTPNGLNDRDSHLQPEIVLASQIRPRSNTLRNSESLLLWAMLADALHVLSTFHPARSVRSAKQRKQFEADLAWIREEEERPFSFTFICHHLGLNHQAVRNHIERLLRSPAADHG